MSYSTITEIEHKLFCRSYSTLMSELRLDPNLSRALDSIETNRGWISPVALAKAAGLSRTVLSGRLRERTGFSPHQFLIRRRILEAAQLILSTDFSLLEIALSVGFRDMNGLDRNFKLLLAMTPRDLRKSGQA